MNTVLFASLMAVLFCMLASFPVCLYLRGKSQSRRLMDLTKSSLRLQEEPKAKTAAWQRILLDATRWIRTRLGLLPDEKLRQRFWAAGFRDPSAIDTYFGIRLTGPVLALLAGTFIRANTFFWIMALIVVAWLAPDLWLNYQTRCRRERIRLALPDALDLMVVCVDAGLAIDQALLRTGQELVLSQPDLSQELLQINLEQRAGKSRLDAWASMADRTCLESVKSFVHMLAQTDRFGTPLARALRVFADGVRQKRRQQAEELAAKTTVKLIFPLVLFIFPCVFIVLLGPAVILIAKNLANVFR